MTIYRPTVAQEMGGDHSINKAAWGLYKSGFIRDIYFRQDRPGVAIFLECDTVEEANNVMAEFPLAKAGLLTFECIPLGSFISWENLFSAEFKHQE